MIKKVRIYLICMILATSFLAAVSNNETANAGGNILYVDAGGTSNYTTIQSAIDDASPGDTIFVYSGIYVENVIVNKSIDLIGECRDSTFIDGAGVGNVVTITSNYVNMSGFFVKNCGTSNFNYGIELDEVQFCILEDIICAENGAEMKITAGIRLHFSDNNTIRRCKCYNNSNDGINLDYSSNNTFDHCDLSNNACGVHLYYSSYNNVIFNCNIYDNQFGIPIYTNSDNNEVYNCTFYDNFWIGLGLVDVSNNIVDNCTFNDNGFLLEYGGGVCIYTSSNNTISNCVFTREDEIINNSGIYLFSSTYNIIKRCTFFSNTHGIQLNHSSNNTLFHNGFYNNDINAFDECFNYWYNPVTEEGNYWSDYTGADSDGDGIGDTPYDIDGGSQDLYPLMYPWDQQKPGPKETVLLVGKTINLNQEDDSYSFNVETVLWISFDPIDLQLLNSGEKIIVDEGYMGALSEEYVFGFFNAKIES